MIPNPDVAFQMLARGGARALVYDPSSGTVIRNPPVPTHPANKIEDEDRHVVQNFELPKIAESGKEEDIVVIFHTSGSTSGMPKLVRGSRKWLGCGIWKSCLGFRAKNPDKQDVFNWL